MNQNHTLGYWKEGNEAFGFDLTLYDPPYADGYSLSGQLYGFGRHGGNYDGEDWIKRNLTETAVISYKEFQNGAAGVNFDSESDQFWAYSRDKDSLLCVVSLLRHAYYQVQRATEFVR